MKSQERKFAVEEANKLLKYESGWLRVRVSFRVRDCNTGTEVSHCTHFIVFAWPYARCHQYLALTLTLTLILEVLTSNIAWFETYDQEAKLKTRLARKITPAAAKMKVSVNAQNQSGMQEVQEEETEEAQSSALLQFLKVTSCPCVLLLLWILHYATCEGTA